MRPRALALALGLVLAACAQDNRVLPEGALAGRPLVMAAEPAPPLERRAAGGVGLAGLGGPILEQIVEGVTGAVEERASRIDRVPGPGIDPARQTARILVEHLVRSAGARPSASVLDAGDIGLSDPDARARALAAAARAQGIEGVIVDVRTTEMAAVSSGVIRGLSREQLHFTYAARFVLADVATGRALAAATCRHDDATRSFSLDEIEAGGAVLVEDAFRIRAQQCAASLIQRALS